MMRVTPVVLCGGAGVRLWPLSRPERPKQFLALSGPGSLFSQTLERVADDTLFEPPVIVAGAGQLDLIREDMAGAAMPAARIMLEPAARNTAAAVALAAFDAAPDALLLVMPSDHVVADVHRFHAAVRSAIPFASRGMLMTFGITPTRPETGYGYIRRGRAIGDGVFRAEAFVEKPPVEVARDYVAGGRHDWNAGIFLFSAAAMQAAIRTHAPDIADGIVAALYGAAREDGIVRPAAGPFAALPSRSIDHAVMEQAADVGVVPVAMDWSDVGSWDSLYEVIEARDAAGNVVMGDARAIDCRGSLLRSDGPRLVAVGISDVIAIATGDAILLMPRGQSQRVREAAAAANDD